MEALIGPRAFLSGANACGLRGYECARVLATQGPDCHLGTSLEIQLRENAADVVLDGPFADDETVGNLAVRSAARQLRNNFSFASSERVLEGTAPYTHRGPG